MKSATNSGTIYKLIEEQLRHLPAEKAHLEMIPYRTAESLRPSINKKEKNSAVLCLLAANRNTLDIILMERTEDGSPHSGQISFPGGKKEQFDNNLSDTALRETYEEIGISRKKITLLGPLTSLYIPVSNFKVNPFIGYTENFDALTLSQKEVKSVFKISVHDLLQPDNMVKKDIPNHLGQILKNIPCFYINGRIIWGATALILNEVKMIFEKIDQNFVKKKTP
ncbi:MAG: CoA pyrophosphatase [Crocinitomicaceae bacterium]